MMTNSKDSTRVVIKNNKPRITGIIIGKYVSLLILIAFIVWLALFQSGSTKSFEEVSQALQESIDDEELVMKGSQEFKKYYGLNSADYEGVLFYTSEFSMSAKEVLLVEVKNEHQIEQVKNAIDARLEERKNRFEGYEPEQVQLLDEAAYVVRGNYIFLAVSPDAEAYRQAFERSL